MKLDILSNKKIKRFVLVGSLITKITTVGIFASNKIKVDAYDTKIYEASNGQIWTSESAYNDYLKSVVSYTEVDGIVYPVYKIRIDEEKNNNVEPVIVKASDNNYYLEYPDYKIVSGNLVITEGSAKEKVERKLEKLNYVKSK